MIDRSHVRTTPLPPWYDPFEKAVERRQHRYLASVIAVDGVVTAAIILMAGDPFSLLAVVAGFAAAIATGRLLALRFRPAYHVLTWASQRALDSWHDLTGDDRFPDSRLRLALLEGMEGGLTPDRARRRNLMLISLLALANRFDDARARLSSVDGLTAYQRVALETTIAYRERGGGDLSTLEAALPDASAPDRLAAEVGLAGERARRLAEIGGDWEAPLRAVAPKLGKFRYARYVNSARIALLRPMIAIFGGILVLALVLPAILR